MNHDFGNSKRCSTQSLHNASPSRPVFLALLLFATTGGAAGKLPAQAAPDSVSSLSLSGDSALGRVCAGDSVVFNVLAERRLANRRAGALPNNPPQRAAGVTINGTMLNPGFGTLKPDNSKTSMRSTPPGSAAFTFTALLPGRTKLRFTGLLPTAPLKRPARTFPPLTRDVEIVSCDALSQAAISPGAAPVVPPVVPPVHRSADVRNPAVGRILRVKVKAISTWKIGMEVIARIDDGVMDADDQGHFTGSASVIWQTSVIGSAGCGATVHPVEPSRAALAGEIDGSNQLVVRITFQPRDFSGIAVCYVAAVGISNVATPNPLTITVPLTGGTSTQPHPVTAKNGTFVGSATIVVTPEPG